MCRGTASTREIKMDVLGKPKAYRGVRRHSRNAFSAFCLLPSAFCSVTESTPRHSTSTKPNSFTHADTFSIADAAAEFASVGCADFVPRIAVGSSAGDRAGEVGRNLVCD